MSPPLHRSSMDRQVRDERSIIALTNECGDTDDIDHTHFSINSTEWIKEISITFAFFSLSLSLFDLIAHSLLVSPHDLLMITEAFQTDD